MDLLGPNACGPNNNKSYGKNSGVTDKFSEFGWSVPLKKMLKKRTILRKRF